MGESFIKKIIVEKVRHIENFEIPLSSEVRKNLILTGKNGSGKSSVLNALAARLNAIAEFTPNPKAMPNEVLRKIAEQIIQRDILGLTQQKENLLRMNVPASAIAPMDFNLEFVRGLQTAIGIKFTEFIELWRSYKDGNFVLLNLYAHRKMFYNTPLGIEKIKTKQIYRVNELGSGDFIQFLVNLKADRAFALDDKKNEISIQIDQWFESFTKALQNIFQTEKIELIFDSQNYTFYIKEAGKDPCQFNHLSDGFTSVLNIVTELIMRMEGKNRNLYDLQGIVLIDEIETHLHIALQKQILPFLTSFFPKIQFIVTTHSPYVINSIDGAIVCDLETREQWESSVAYDSEAITNAHFMQDKFSIKIKEILAEYERLAGQEFLEKEDSVRFSQLKDYFDKNAASLSDELALRLKDIKLKQLTKK
jgi:predicted ATP-binding protein involved in virulence